MPEKKFNSYDEWERNFLPNKNDVSKKRNGHKSSSKAIVEKMLQKVSMELKTKTDND